MSNRINSNYNYTFNETNDSSKRQKTPHGYSAEVSNDADLKHKATDGGLGDYFSYIQEANRDMMMREGEGIHLSSITVENGPLLPSTITENLFSETKAKTKVSFAQLLQDHPQIFQDYDICSASELEITLMPNPDALTATDGDDGVNAIRYRLEGYDHFVVRLNRQGQIEVIDRACFEEGLARWGKSQNSDRIEEAVRRITEAFDSNANRLELNFFDLTSLPKEMAKLSNLSYLDLACNDLTTLPTWIGDFSELKTLHLRKNEITTLPGEMGQLSKLERLDLENNQLTSLPNEIGQLSCLHYLNIGSNPLGDLPAWIGNLLALTHLVASDIGLESLPDELFNLIQLTSLTLTENRLQRLPPEIGNFSHLRELHLFDNSELQNLPLEITHLTQLGILQLSGCTNLSSLPLALGNCSQLTFLEIEDTRIPEGIANAILAACQRRREGDVLSALPQRLAIWQAVSGREFQLDFIEELEIEKKEAISEWLLRLERTEDFNSSHQQELAEAACGILQSLNELPSFKEDFFVQVPVNNVNCGDRAGMAFNEIYLVWRLATLPDDASENDKLKLMAQAAKTLVFRKALGSMFAEHERAESVEIYLYYEVKLKEELDLLTAMKSMSYEAMGKKDWIENSLGALKEKVEADFLNEMLDFAPLQKMAEADWLQAKQEFDQRLEKIENTMTDENTYLTQMNQLSHRAFVRNWLEEKLQLVNYQRI